MRYLTAVVRDHGNVIIYQNHQRVHSEIRLQSSGILQKVDRVPAILRVDCNKELFTLKFNEFLIQGIKSPKFIDR